jgi:hypothetical protein
VSRSRAEWLAEGIEAGFCSDVVCLTHDGVPMSAEEAGQWEDGDDPCAAVVRVDGKWNHGKGEC